MLTKREKEVLKYVCEGYTNHEIGKILNISYHTSKAHIISIMRKLGAKDRTNAAYWAGRYLIVDLADTHNKKEPF